MDQLITVLGELITLVTSAIHGDHRGPQIRSWDGTTINVEMNGLMYTATCDNWRRDNTGADRRRM